MEGVVKPPSSKSISHRALILAALSKGSKISNLLNAEDTNATKSCLEQLGVRYSNSDDSLIVEESLPNKLQSDITLDCKNSGTTLRLLMGICAGFDTPVTLAGDDSLNRRPISPLTDALKSLGVSILTENPTPPVTLKGPVDRLITNIEITGRMSSQFISSLLLVATRHQETFTINITPPIVSHPYISLTSEMLQEVGVKVEVQNNSYITHPSEYVQPHFRIPMDFSSAAFFLSAGALPGNSITVEGYFGNYTQADRRILSIIAQMGAHMEKHATQDHSSYKVVGDELFGEKINLMESPDLFPILAVLATQAEGETILHGAQHLKYKETDRIEKMTQVIKILGGNITPTEDGAIIVGSRLKGGVSVDSYGDHRIAMAAAVAGSVCEKPIKILNSISVDVSYPSFFEDFKRLQVK